MTNYLESFYEDVNDYLNRNGCDILTAVKELLKDYEEYELCELKSDLLLFIALASS